MRTRGNGEGSFDKLPSGKWRCRKTIMTPAGTYKTIQATAKTKQKAAEQLRQKEEKYSLSVSDITVEEFSQEYMEVGCSEGLIKRTTLEKTIRPTFKNRINPALGKKKLIELKRSDVQRWVNELAHSKCLRKNQQLTKKGVEKILGVLKASLTWAVDMEYISHNPALRIKVPDLMTEEETNAKKDQKDEDYLSEEELNRFFSEVKIPDKYPTKNVMLFMLYTGCRPGEALGLTWDSVEKDRIRIRKTLEEIHGQKPYLDRTKTAETRDIGRTSNIDAILLEQKEQQKKCQKLFGLSWKPVDNLVFTQTDGKPFTAKMLYGQVGKVGKAIDLKNTKGAPRRLHPHSLRHTFITLMISSGTMTLSEVSRYVGHTSVKTTEKYYNLGKSEQNKRNAEKAESFFDAVELPERKESSEA